MAYRDKIDTDGGYLNSMITLQIPCNARLTEAIRSAQVKDLFFNFRWGA